MVNPYDFIASPAASKSKSMRKKTMAKNPTKRKSNEKRRRASIRETSRLVPRRPGTSVDQIDLPVDPGAKENNHNGFTQLIQTKMLEVKKRQGKRTNRQTSPRSDGASTSSVLRKRQRPETEETSAVIPTDTGTHTHLSLEIGIVAELFIRITSERCPVELRRRPAQAAH